MISSFASEIKELREWGETLEDEIGQLRPLRENNASLIEKLSIATRKVELLEAEAKKDVKEREALLARESIWAEELSALKELVHTFKDSLELEKIKNHDDTHVDEKSLLTSVQVSNEVEAQKALIGLQEDEVLMLQSEVYDLLTLRNFDLMSCLLYTSPSPRDS